MLERNHYRETSAGPDMCRVKTRRVSLGFKCHLGVWGRHDQECSLLNPRVWRLLARSQSGSGGASPLVGGIRASPTMGSPFLAKIRILKGMYPDRPNGNCYSLRKPYLSALPCMLVHSALHLGRGWGDV